MQQTLHLYSAHNATFPTTRFPFNHPNFLSLPRLTYLHLPHLSSSKSPTISLPPNSSQTHSVSLTLQKPQPQLQNHPVPTNPNPQFEEKMIYLASMDIDLLTLVTTNPPLASVPINQIKSIVEYLHSIGLTTTDLRRIFSMCPEILTQNLTTIVPVITFLLREARINGKDLRHVIHRRPRLLTCGVATRLRPTLFFLHSTIGLEDVRKQTSLLSCSVEQKFVPRIDYFQKLGFSYRETISMFRRFPSLFCYSIESNFEPKFDYFVVEMGRDMKELKDFPQYFSFSLENRIKPRHRKCVEKRVCLSLPEMLKSSEERFKERLEVCYSSSMPQEIFFGK
ncbi:unnamed protein product [Ilex paraguariensis]|uniref:Uncharacterized protein n=1 Tax=Ilex paraguariensis TaxID=185542 RepID=A0ABC8UIB7_9AQUA